jgi:hypothetical protein
MNFARDSGNSASFFQASQYPNRGSLSRTFVGSSNAVGLDSSRTYSAHEQSQNNISAKIDNLRKYIRDLSSQRGRVEGGKPTYAQENIIQAPSSSSSRLQTEGGRIGILTDKKKNFLRTAGLSRDFSTTLDQSGILNQSRDSKPPRGGLFDFQSPGGLAAFEKRVFSPLKNAAGKSSTFDSSKKLDNIRNLNKTPQQKMREDINNIL